VVDPRTQLDNRQVNTNTMPVKIVLLVISFTSSHQYTANQKVICLLLVKQLQFVSNIVPQIAYVCDEYIKLKIVSQTHNSNNYSELSLKAIRRNLFLLVII
jgi:hypothetical protein